MKARNVLVFAVLCCVVCGNSVFASSFMGAPKAGLQKGQYSIGFDYSYNDMDIEFGEGKSLGAEFNGIVKGWKSDILTARFGYGFSDTVEVAALLGGVRMRHDFGGERFSGDEEWAYGFGGKFTLCEEDNVAWGGLFQMSWYEAEGKWSGPGWIGNADVDYTHIQIAFGPTVEMFEGVAVYGGPFWQCIDGEKKYTAPGEWEKYDIDAASNCGAYLGAQFDLTASSLFNVEYQLTDDDNILGLNISWLF